MFDRNKPNTWWIMYGRTTGRRPSMPDWVFDQQGYLNVTPTPRGIKKDE